jgi:methyltransferase
VWVIVLVVGLVAATMLAEAGISQANERTLRAGGAVEPRDDVYAVMQVAYPGCFLAMAAEAWWREAPPGLPAAGLAVFGLAKALKWWAMASLGVRWTFRVLVPPSAGVIRRGPYRLIRHPNYVAVVGELAGVALALGATMTGAAACLGFGALMWVRIRVEERALGLRPGGV